MRHIILVAGAALALTACGSNGQAGNTTNINEGLTADNIVSNDITAIDAVTGDAANMAADMPLDATNEMGNDLGNAATPGRPTSRSAARPESANEAPTANASTTNKAAVTNRPAADESTNSTE
jgi:hypothetical protein